jgi:predicted transcriptional regulator
MKYKKGTFVVVPNLEELKGKPSEMQAIYLWICQHANNDGLCFPKKVTISKEAGCSHNTVDKYLKQLVEDGFIEITQRKTKEGKNTSNEYQLLILGCGDVKNGLRSHPNIGSQTISNINYTNITNTQPEVVPVKVKEVKPFSFEEEMQKLIDSTWKRNKIIYLYFLKKKFKFDNMVQFKAEYKRNLRPAGELEGYNSQQIEQTMNKMDELGLSWTLNAIGRNISNVINSQK